MYIVHISAVGLLYINLFIVNNEENAAYENITKELSFCHKFRFYHTIAISMQPEAEFKEFEPRIKFKPRLKYGWFHLKSYSLFQELSRRSIETGFGRILDAAQIH